MNTSEIQFPSEISRGSYVVKTYIEKDNKLLYWYDYNLNSIYIFDLVNQELYDKVNFTDEGPEGIKEIYGFTIFSPDSIFISTPEPGKIYWLNKEGKVVEKITFIDNPDKFNANEYTLLNCFARTDLYLHKDKLMVPLRTPNFRIKPAKEDLKKFNIITSVPDDGTCSISLPKIFFNDKGLPISNSLTSCKIGNDIVFSFKGDHELYIVNNCEVKKRKVLISRYSSDFIGIDGVDYFSWKCRTFEYGNLYEDKYSNKIYRIAKLSNPNINEDCSTEGIYPSQFSIMVISNDFEVIKEIKIEGKKYSIIHCFVDENGLNMLRSPYHPEYEEELLTFDAFKF